MHASVLFSSEVLEQLRSRHPLKYLDYCFEYLILLPPGDEVAGKVTGWKKDMMSDLRRNRSLYSLPHFTIACLLLPEVYEGHLLRAFASACASIAPQRLSVDGFGNFPNGRGRNVIFVGTPDLDFFAAAQLQVKRALRVEGLKRCAQFSSNPHLTIAKDLPDISFNKQWKTFGGLDYRASFYADKLVLVRRRLQRYSKCDEPKTLPLLGATGEHLMPPVVEQPLLF